MDTKPNWLRRNPIGKGSFGVVSLAVAQPDSDFIFAVKSVNHNSGEFLRCLDNEIRILKSLSSPYVVKYLGDDVTFESPSEVYRNLHMEYMPGGTVADVAKHGDCVNIRNYTRCITSALRYIHARNIVHCDVKGKNVLIGDTPGTAKLADFGSAIELGVPSTGTRGSPLWMAPEVIRGEYQGPESDVWSLGCTVIEILTGKPPWPDRGADTLRQIGYSDDLPNIPNLIPYDLRDFLDKCLRRERSERWSCDQLLHHPFLLSCSSPSSPQITIDNCKSSPRCVFDWLDSTSSNESTLDIYEESHTKTSDAKQRIGKLASGAGVVWETEGWEVVRHVTVTTASELPEQSETTPECSNCVEEEASVSGYTEESNDRYNYDHQSTSNEARGTTADAIYRSYMFAVVSKKLFQIILLILKFIQDIHYTQWFTSTQTCFSITQWNNNRTPVMIRIRLQQKTKKEYSVV